MRGIAQGPRVLEPLVLPGFSPPRLVLFIAAYFLLASEPEMHSTHFGRTKGFGGFPSLAMRVFA